MRAHARTRSSPACLQTDSTVVRRTCVARDQRQKKGKGWVKAAILGAVAEAAPQNASCQSGSLASRPSPQRRGPLHEVHASSLPLALPFRLNGTALVCIDFPFMLVSRYGSIEASHHTPFRFSKASTSGSHPPCTTTEASCFSVSTCVSAAFFSPARLHSAPPIISADAALARTPSVAARLLAHKE